jgi:hypothetical protein
MRLDALEAAAQQGRLHVSPAEAAAHILGASSGVTLSLIQQPLSERDLSLSTVIEDATSGLTAGERALMRELLVRLADEL